ncbi:hypothetical protein N7474_002565 [Penicillium riverlandense]|uniref:uncharacterized protein n=1 Tax=Penicillium riverlandense TaxID=1903569 RepID=UPI0025477903|nr:uncharacterized protein N7474_002565 [Penicillium riverlandense]KAJ5825427.1 hypothetical protein N7474_002565 [Penicillium riverlandense]
MDIDGMTLANISGYPNVSDMLVTENYGYSHILDWPELQNLIVRSSSFGSAGDSGIIPVSSSSDGRFLSTYLGPMADRADSLQLSQPASNSIDPFTPSQCPDIFKSSSTKVDQKAKEKLSPASNKNEILATKRKSTRIRRQNRSCDPCRSAKRACDLPFNLVISNNLPLSPCSMCKLRGMDCTAAWRSSKQSVRHGNERAPPPFIDGHDTDGGPDAITERIDDSLPPTSPTSLSCNECALVSRMMASEIWSQRLAVYIDIFDIPVSKLLSPRCMPPCYSLGIAALRSLSHNSQLAARINQTQLSIRSSWKMNSPPQSQTSAVPNLFVAASILDMLFQRTQSCPEDARLSSRDDILTETYKWVAVATGSQFAVREYSAENIAKSQQQVRDIAYATWRKAKDMVFTNIAARKSFRLGLSLLLFGTILPPTKTDQSHEFQDDAAYAFHEGICRLQTLCTEARVNLRYGNNQPDIITPLMGRCHSARSPPLSQNLSTDEYEKVLELIAALEWLIEMSQSVAIALFPYRSFTVAPSIIGLKTGINHPVEDTFQGLAMKGVDDAIIARVKAETQPVTVLWSQGSPEHLVQNALYESGSLVVLLWKSLARLTLATQNAWSETAHYADIQRHFNTMIMLIDIWRTSFGTIDHTAAKRLQLATTDLRRSVIFCATDGDLAVLLFHELSCQIEKQMVDRAQLPKDPFKEKLKQTSNYRNLQRLTSAMQISSLSSTCQGVSSPGFQGEVGLKANIEDVRAHPHPTMVVQAYKLAANALAEEIQNSVPTADTKRISELSIGLQNCLRELRGLQSTLVMYPSTDWGDGNFNSP